MSTQPDLERLQSIKTLHSLVAYLKRDLDWPIEADEIEDVFFEYEPEELGLAPDQAAGIKEIKQLRPMDAKQPWGIFWVNFEKKRLPVVMLRRILGHLVIKKRASANKADRRAWHLNDLLFISAYGEDTDRAITFAHFAQEEESPGDLPVLKVLGWDGGDTVLHLADAHQTLTEKLRWPDDPADTEAWRQQWGRVFTLRHREVITTTQELVEELAHLATSIRKRARNILARESERGRMRKLYAAFKTALIHDLSEDGFADVIAQTISYGLLAARFSRPAGISVRNLVDMVPPTNPFLGELLGEFLAVAGRKKGAFDFDELGIQDVVELLNRANAEAVKSDFGNRTRDEDPVIHFYEDFLAAYDKKKKAQRGVFFTPQPVVTYIVRSVHELLQTEFGLEDGLADTTTWGEMLKRSKDLKIPDGAKPGDPFVVVLDPATGTATFLVEVIEVIFTHLKAKWTRAGRPPAEISKAWNEYVPRNLLPRLYGYELMMAPYTIAHMKLGLKLSEINARLGQPDYQFRFEGRAHIYLTNSLEPAVDDKQGTLEGIFPALAHEAAAVNTVKRNKRFTIVIGNPPYSISSSNLSETHRAIVEPYKWIDGKRLMEKGARQFEKNIQDDYVKFIRLAEVAISSVRTGIVGYITNHSYLTNPTFRGLRHSLLQSFRRGDFVDLHGNTLYGEAKEGHADDQNVFDIKQGVAICLLRSQDDKEGREFRRVDYWGSQAVKCRELESRSILMDEPVPLHPGPDFWVFRVEDKELRDEYQVFPRISELMPLNSTGVKTHRDHFALAFDQSALKSRLETFRDRSVSDKEIESRFELADTDAWRLSAKRKSLASRADWEKFFALVIHRPFDLKWIYYHPDVVELPRAEVMQNLLPRGPNNAAICFPRNLREGWKYHAFVSRDVVHKDALSSLDTCYAAPLFIASASELNFSQELTPNLARGVRDWIKHLGMDLKPATCWQAFGYFYAILFAPSYGSRYAEFLKSDFPRLPLTASLDLFRALAKLGDELVALHLMESPKLDKRITQWIGGKAPVVEKVTYSDETVWIDKAQTEGIRGVPEPVWNFRIGGYQVCEKWLKDRKGRTLSDDDIEHYHRIVVALSETIRLMAEIDKVIDSHGGWPAAFLTKKTNAGA